VSWVGRNVRDNSEQPASVLVAQLRDYLQAGWNFDPVSITTEHALQPFSRRYFERGGLLTYAGEWRAAHAGAADESLAELPPYELEPDFRLKLAELAGFLKQPARYFFRRRLGVSFGEADVVGEDEEPFALDALERYFLEDSLLDDSGPPEPLHEVREALAGRAEKLAREGVLPIGLVGRQWQEQLVDDLVPVRSAWLRLGARFPAAAPKLAVSRAFGGVVLEDWIDRLRTGEDGAAWLLQISSKVLDKRGEPRGEKLILPWLRQLAAAAAGASVTGYLVARDAVVRMAPLEQGRAEAVLGTLVEEWRRNLNQPLAVACKSALAALQDGDPRTTYDGGFEITGEVQDPCLARLWPDFAALVAGGDWPGVAESLYGALVEWMETGVTVATLQGEQA
jgi:exodeoxyribonuclease V gamma subunit